MHKRKRAESIGAVECADSAEENQLKNLTSCGIAARA
jgi:hypothetical protein